MPVFVTGGTGFLGRRVVARLVSSGQHVVLLARETSNVSGLPEGIRLVRGDVTDFASVRQAVRGCDTIVHMAALVKMWAPDRRDFYRINVEGVENVVTAAEMEGVGKFVYCSSFIALGPTDGGCYSEENEHAGKAFFTEYERTKYLADRFMRQAIRRGLPAILLYPGVIYGEGELTEGNYIVRMIIDYARGKIPGIIGDGRRIWSFVYIDDVVEGFLSALKRGRLGERYLLAGDNRTLEEFFLVLSKLSGLPAPKLKIPYAIASLVGLFEEIKARSLRIPPRITREVVKVYKHDWAYLSQRAQRELGYKITPLEEGLRRTVEWLKRQGLI